MLILGICMGRKAKSRRVTMQKRKRMSAVKGKFREQKKERAAKAKKIALSGAAKKERRKVYKKVRPKVDRSTKKSFLKKMREKAKTWGLIDE